MPIAIITKKFSPLTRNQQEQEGYRSLCADEKNNYVRDRLFKILKPNKKTTPNFRRLWFCIGCCNFFSLKPIKKYKTLLQFPLQCPECKSQKVSRNGNFINAITNRKHVDELLFANIIDIKIECEIRNFKRYHLELKGNTKQENLPDFVITIN